jgi:hypothetical protein
VLIEKSSTLPKPRVAIFSLPGLALASFSKSCQVLNRRLNHHRDGSNVIHAPARVLSGEERVRVGDVNGGGIAIRRGREELGHAGRAGRARNIDHGNALLEQRFRKFADQPRQLIRAAARAPGYDQLDRPFRVLGACRHGGERERSEN